MILTEKEVKQTYLFKKKIEFELNNSAEYVELREFNTEEQKQFQLAANYKNDDGDYIAALSKAEEFFPKCLVGSSFVDEEGNCVDGKTLCNYLKKSSTLFQMILAEWLKNDDNPFALTGKKN